MLDSQNLTSRIVGASGAASLACNALPSSDTITNDRCSATWLDRRFTIDDFEIGRRPIGQGKFGTVFRVRERSSRRILVLKVINKRAILDEDVKPQLQREVEVHTRLVHPNIARMYAYFTDAEQVYLLLEWANSGSLYEKLQTSTDKRIDERSAAGYTRQLLLALEHCHSKHVIHRDVKPENLLLHKEANGDTVLKLADFGWSVAQRIDSRRTTLCGTVEYLPPEVVAGGVYDFSFDMWTVGVLTYEMILGVSPFFARDQDGIMARIVGGRYAVETEDGAVRLSTMADDFIRQLLTLDPSMRMSASQSLAHPWLAQFA